MKASLQEAVNQIKAAGFSHIKVELEGDIGRDGEGECYDCEGGGQQDCGYCYGEGYVDSGSVTRLSGEAVMEECGDCYGDGRVDCDNCNGTGDFGGYQSEEWCEDFMREWAERKSPGIGDRLVYGRFYEDGSVDSEFTFTVHIDDIEDVLVWQEAFKAVADECGQLDVSGAGLHVSILPESSNGSYPCHGRLPSDRLANFESEITKLMPALFFLASSGHQSRDLGYRHPKVGEDKYCAISTHDGTSFEYRVFETCYDRPEAFYDYVKVIANTLKFYADPSLKVNALGKKFGFNDGDTLARFYDTPEQLRILNATVKHLKPKDKTFKKLKEERGVRYTIKNLATKEKVRLAQLRDDYRQYRRRFMEVMSRPLTESQIRDRDYLMLHENMSVSEAEAHVRGQYNGSKMMTLREFIDNNITNQYQEVLEV